MDAEELRLFLLELPEVEEYEHGGLPAFRVRRRRIASMLDDNGVNLMLGAEQIHAAVAEWPRWCRVVWFGSRPAALHIAIALPEADAAIVRELATDAWRARAPKTLVRAFDDQR